MPDEREINPYSEDSDALSEDDQAFSDAFVESNSEQPGDTDTDTSDTDGDETTASADTAADDDDASDPKPPKQADTSAADESADTVDDNKPASSAADASAAVAADPMAEIAALKQQLAALQQPQQPQQPAQPPAEAPPMYTDEEAALLKQYAEDWGDVQRGEALTRRAEYHHLAKYIFDQIQDAYGPVLDYYENRSGRDQYSDLKALIPDYDDIREHALAWVDQQPAYLKAAYQQVTQQGTAEEVADLFNRYKQETGHVSKGTIQTNAATGAVASAGNQAASIQKPSTAADAKKVAAAAALKVVKSSRTETTSAPDPDDFSTAFKEFSAMK